MLQDGNFGPIPYFNFELLSSLKIPLLERETADPSAEQPQSDRSGRDEHC
jgi:hypothetical protein